MRKLTNLILICWIACALSSCEKAQIESYQNDPRIHIMSGSGGRITAVQYSFAIRNSSVIKDTVWVPVRIMGLADAKPRKINFQVVSSETTAQEGKHFSLTDYTMPAGEYKTNLAIVIFRTPDLQDTEVKLQMKLLPSEDFEVGVGTNLDYSLTINDILSKPDNWDGTLQSRFGVFSKVKFRFMIDVLGSEVIQTITTTSILLNELLYYKQKVRNAWIDYEQVHGPMLDENNNPITFPA
ncbi:MAG TPA: DUF4843 domain-containing protein [Parasegetibacter sp.]|jgi:hypothetical protein